MISETDLQELKDEDRKELLGGFDEQEVEEWKDIN